MAAGTFTENGGDFNIYTEEYGEHEMNWSNKGDVENWIKAPYEGDVNVTNETRLDNIEMSFYPNMMKVVIIQQVIMEMLDGMLMVKARRI